MDSSGLKGKWSGIHDIVDHYAATQPQALAIQDASGVWTYAQLQEASLRAAAYLDSHDLTRHAHPAPDWGTNPSAPRPLAIRIARSKEFYALCIGAWRLGLPVVAMSCDMADKTVETTRNSQIMSTLQPFALVTDRNSTSLTGCPDVPSLQFSSAILHAALPHRRTSSSPVSCESVMVYVYTGGTTKASKCVTVTHAMALWEAENYSTALGGNAGSGDKMLQYSSLYWGAAVFGQFSLGFSVGACVCIGGNPGGDCTGAGDALQQIVVDVSTFRVTVLGIVPSQLRGAWPGGPTSAPDCLRVLVSWADKCPVDLSRQWTKSGIKMVDLLIASEYWLALYSDCAVWNDNGTEKHIYRKLPSLDARFLVASDNEDGMVIESVQEAKVGEVGEMYLAGPTVSPGYICPDGRVGLVSHGAARIIDGKLHLRTRDKLRLLPGGGLVYAGRADSLMKHGGQWVDIDALQDKVCAVPGVSQAALIPGAQGIDLFVVLQNQTNENSLITSALDSGTDGSPAKKLCVRNSLETAPFRVLANIKKALPGARLHVRTELPLNAATAKIDRAALVRHLHQKELDRQHHIEKQEDVEKRTVAAYGIWGLLVVGMACGPQVLASTMRAVRGSSCSAGGFFHTLILARLCGACALKLCLLPEVWVACAYLEHHFNPPGCSPWHPPYDRLARLLQTVYLPRQWSRWFPILLTSVLPPTWLLSTSVALCAYLGWSRENDGWIAAGFASICAAITTNILPNKLLAVDSSLIGKTLGPLGMSLLALSPNTRELLSYLCAAPGLFYQVIPKFVSDDFGWLPDCRLCVGPLKRLAARLRLPNFNDRIAWDSSVVVVAEQNRWDLVHLAGPRGENAWRTQGLVVGLHWDLVGSASLARALGNLAEGNGATAKIANGSENGNKTHAQPPGTNGSNPLAALVERICNGASGPGALHGIDSMQAIQLAEGVRREFGKPLKVADVLRCSDVEELMETMKKAQDELPLDDKTLSRSRRNNEGRIWLCGMGPRACTVDWIVCQEDRSQHLDVLALQRAVNRLVDRHEALRARNAPEQPMFLPTYDAASLWQLSCSSGQSWTRSGLGRLASRSIFEAWPRCKMDPPGSEAAHVELLRPKVEDVIVQGWRPKSDDEVAFWVGGVLYGRRKPNGQRFSLCLVPIFKDAHGAAPESDAVAVAQQLPPAEVQWYIYAVLDHGFCDGPAGLPLFADLLRLYAEEAGHPDAEPPRECLDAFGVLQSRLCKSLQPLPEAEHPNDDIFHDGLVHWGYRKGYQRFIQFDANLMKVMRYASREILGCSLDVVWLTAISAAFLRLFPTLRRLDLFLIVTCRDKPAEESMIGYFSSRKMLPLEVGDPSCMALLGLSDVISTARRQRAWNRPRPYEKCSSACIEVNIVGQATDGLPAGFREARYARSAGQSWDRAGTSCMQVRLDQSGRDSWDFRLQSHDATWGCDWSTYFGQALGSVLVDLARNPTGPVVYASSNGKPTP